MSLKCKFEMMENNQIAYQIFPVNIVNQAPTTSNFLQNRKLK